MMNLQPPSTEYLTLRDGAAIHRRAQGGVLALTGADRADFLQRMTTNDLVALRPGHSAVTVLTSSVARILFVFTVIARPDELWVLPALGQATALANHLRSQIFFMDKVKVQEMSPSLARLRVMGPLARDTLSRIGIHLIDGGDGVVVEQDGITAIWQERYDIPGTELLIPSGDEQRLLDRLTAAGASLIEHVPALKARRIELGRPGVGRELSEEYNPLEVGLAWTCAENKGCYTGQEIIARQLTYDKVTRTLVGLRSDQLLAEGADISVDGRKVGSVTSAAHSPTLDAPVALAVVKRPHHETGTGVMVADANAEIVKLPFVPSAG